MYANAKLLAAAILMLPVAAAAGPIMIVMDLHADPMFGTPTIQEQVYHEWVDNANWLLDVAEPRGAKVSFLTTGEFAEWAIEDAVAGHAVIQRLYASGGLIGTHSHNRIRIGAHNWQALPPDPTAPQVLQHWNNHVTTINILITAALGLTDPAEIAAVNCVRGTHTPSDDAWRIQLMSDFGFTNHQQGPGEQLFAYFKHYPMNPYRPLGTHFLEHDPSGPVVAAPFGPVLGRNEVHYNIEQDMRMPAVQVRFLLELLNWLHDRHIAETDRVWLTGWASHASDIAPGTPTRDAMTPMLDWLLEHFVNQPVGGEAAAAFASMVDVRDAFYSWEAAHPGEVSFSYPADETRWDLYPYLIPAAKYLTDAWYDGAMPPVGAVRWHQVTAAATIGGPFPLYVAYTTDTTEAVVDLSPMLGSTQMAAVDPATGAFVVYPTTAVSIPVTGAMLMAPANVIGGAAIPTTSEWGLAVLALLALCAGGSILMRQPRRLSRCGSGKTRFRSRFMYADIAFCRRNR